MSYEPKLGEQVVKGQDGVELLIRRHGPRTRHAAIRKGEHPWLPATYEDLLDFIVGKPATAEEPSEVAEPAPAPVRYRCEGCGWEGTEAVRDMSGSGALMHLWSGPTGQCGPVVPVGKAG